MQLIDLQCVYSPVAAALRRSSEILLAILLISCAAATEPETSSKSSRPSSLEATTETRAVEAAIAVFPRIPVLDCTPIAETGYRQGRGFPIRALTIDGRLIESKTAEAYWAMQLAAAEDGIELPIYSAFRNHEDQAYFYDCFKSCSCNQCAPASRPGHSKHQSGSAIDFGQWPGVIDWLRNNAKRFRFFATVRREPWHWEYRPRKNKRRRKQWPTLCESETKVEDLSRIP